MVINEDKFRRQKMKKAFLGLMGAVLFHPAFAEVINVAASSNGGWISGSGGSLHGASLNTIIDGVFRPRYISWINGTVYWYGTADPYIEISFNNIYRIESAIVQADDNDSYTLLYWNLDNLNWQTAWDVPNYDPYGSGMQTRPNPSNNLERYILPSPIVTNKIRIKAAEGDYHYSVSEVQAYGSRAIFPEISVSPLSGPVGTKITIQGQNFATQTQVSIDFGAHQTITTTLSSEKGTFSTTFIVDTQPSCTKVITARDILDNVATTCFKITSRIILVSPISGFIGNIVTISGVGFAENSTIFIDFGTHQTIASMITLPHGTFVITFTVDTQPPCTKTITARDFKEIATTIFRLIPEPRI
ncbi:TPA: hypothetical protein DCX16_06635, partial [bacterium]|nr:hypothetical protein [bacterium]